MPKTAPKERYDRERGLLASHISLAAMRLPRNDLKRDEILDGFLPSVQYTKSIAESYI
jgi:hypothetical protein